MVMYGRYAGESLEERDARISAEEETEGTVYARVTNPRVLAVLDVIAPERDGDRIPVFEFGHETTPTSVEIVEMATEIVTAIDRSVMPP
jgi:hypothetical protein